MDIDHFKEYNDYYGHVMGDECLRQIGKVLSYCINRDVDLAARYGGEEFACILPDTDIYSAVEIAERIRERIEALKIEHKDSPISEFLTAKFWGDYSSIQSCYELLLLLYVLMYYNGVAIFHFIDILVTYGI